MSIIKYDLAKYTTKFLIGTSLLKLYNILIDKKSFTNMDSWYDAMSFGASSVISNGLNDLLFELLHMSNQGLIPMLSEPVLNMFIYNYMYDNVTRFKVRGLGSERTQSKILMIGFGGNVLLKWLENPILGLFHMKSY